MRVLDTSDTGSTIEFDHAELALLANALNEALEAVDGDEFETRVGASVATAESLQEELAAQARRAVD